MVDLLAAEKAGYQAMIERAVEEKWGEGVVKGLRRKDLVEMKRKRGSHSDLADIEALEKGNGSENGKS